MSLSLLGRLRDRIEHFGCFIQTRGVVSRLQTGVIRTNCMDCLDRTNVVQSMIAAENLNRILREIGILAAHEIIDTYTDFYNLFRFVWADHANVIGKNSGRLLP